MSAFVDGVLTVVSAKSSLSQTDYESIDFLESLKEKNLGAVLNDVEMKEMDA
ncbi:hypothetical protein [Reichenbachiella ulvae]|uniref:Uncharacterized protein n=1 Tax=Reichenbachiella ulvae TaxID=2980104 RepID=A0ABT3D0J7_9BACT|nr:hypothetical protein [Reichenbachiella ulvae]MCV9389471.1 hypothetical protein [Reichenbachiella ulvae]